LDIKRIFVIEDDFMTRSLLVKVLDSEGFEAEGVGDGPDALEWLQRNGLPHLILVDLGLPTMTGFEVCKRVKKMGDVPIIVLSGNKDAATELLNLYADDYIRKPYDVPEVIARIRRVLSRITDFSYARGRVVTIDSRLSIDFTNNVITRDGEMIPLTPIETGLLAVLVQHRGTVISAETLLARVWRKGEAYEDTLRVHMHRLRRKLHVEGSKKDQYIQTERGSGYLFSVPDSYQ
jgi:DNA-binding response OmpR family regulator